MEISSMTSRFGLETRMLATAAAVVSPSRTTTSTTTNSRRTLNVSAKFSSGISVTSSSTSNISPLFGGSVTSDFSNHTIRPPPLTSSSFSSSRIKRNVITMVIPFTRGSAFDQPPPDLATHLLNNRIIFLGMALVPAVTELIFAELLFLDGEDQERPAYLYINSTGTIKGQTEASYTGGSFVIYDAMRMFKAPIYTLAVGNSWGEAAMLLAAGDKGCRAALPSASIMLKQPFGRGQGQATNVENYRKAIKLEKEQVVDILAHLTGKDREQMEKDIRRPKYFSPSAAIEYGIIDRVLYNKKAPKDQGVVSSVKNEDQGVVSSVKTENG